MIVHLMYVNIGEPKSLKYVLIGAPRILYVLSKAMMAKGHHFIHFVIGLVHKLDALDMTVLDQWLDAYYQTQPDM